MRIEHLKTIVARHVYDCLDKLDRLQEREKLMFTPSETFVGNASLDLKHRTDRMLHGHVHSLLAESLLVPGADEDKLMLEILRRENNIKGDEISMKLESSLRIFKKSLFRIREYINHELLRTLAVLVKSETYDQLIMLQKQFFLSTAYVSAPVENKPLFTAQNVIDYLKHNCYKDNKGKVKSLKRDIERITRRNGETLLRFLHRFPTLISELEATSGKKLKDKEQIELWKLNFANNINLSEKMIIRVNHSEHLTDAEWLEVKDFAKGKFDVNVLNKLITGLGNALTTSFKPDLNVQDWNRHRKEELRLDIDIDNEIPTVHKSLVKRKTLDQSNVKSSRSSQRKRHKTSRVTIPSSEFCKHPTCIARNLQRTHRFVDCRFRLAQSQSDNTGSRQKLRTGTPNRPTHPKFQRPQPSPQKTGPPRQSDDKSKITCLHCGKTGHTRPDCPNYKRIQSKLTKSSKFMSYLSEVMDTDDLWEGSTRIIRNYKQPDLCLLCCRRPRPSCTSPSMSHLVDRRPRPGLPWLVMLSSPT